MTIYYVESGVRKFADLARQLADDLGVSLRALKPFLRGWYVSAQDDLEEAGEDVSDMDDVGTLKGTLAALIAEEETEEPSKKKLPMTVIQPPWRRMAEEHLKHLDPTEYQRLKRRRELEDHLDQVAERAKEAYKTSVRKLSAENPGQESFIMQSVQEVVTRDILDPTS
ncbi:MAG: hypothetical protein IIB36_12230 [Gemmatimonadetes bacterium]|nr:hypothetical protein [Gemmatimonadota bacterium]